MSRSQSAPQLITAAIATAYTFGEGQTNALGVRLLSPDSTYCFFVEFPADRAKTFAVSELALTLPLLRPGRNSVGDVGYAVSNQREVSAIFSRHFRNQRQR